ncbi:MAG TPA: hypothetical protein VGN17_21310 [Bryobacteraceae bacterium]
MASAPLPKIAASKAAEICAQYNLAPEAKSLLVAGMAPGEFVGALVEHKQYVAGIDFLCHALPPREAIWWGCLCMQHASGDDEFPPPGKAAAIAAVRWVMQPTDENRAAAKSPAEAAGAGSSAGALAGAVTQTGPPAPMPDLPNMPAPPTLVWAKSVATAVKLASIKGDPARMLHRQRALLELGLGVAEGRFLN